MSKMDFNLAAAALEAVGVAVFICDAEGSLVFVNRRAAGLLGSHPEALLGKPVWEASPALGAQEDWEEGWRRLREEGEAVLTGPLEAGDGGTIWVEAVYRHIQVSGDEFAIASVLDLTDQRATERSLRENEAKYQALVANLPDVTWATDKEGKTLFISPNVQEVYGFTADEIREAGPEIWFGRIHPEDQTEVMEAYGKLFSDPSEPFDMEYRVRRKDGEWIWLHDRALTTVDLDGGEIAYGIFTDITARKAQQKDIRLTQTAVDLAADPLAWVRPDGGFEFVNEALRRVTGYSKHQLLSMRFWDLDSGFLEEDWPEFWERVREERAVRYDTYFRTRAGESVPVELVVNSMDFEGDTYLGAFGRDLTEIKKAQQALQESEERYQTFIASIPDVTWIQDREGRVIFVSRNVQEVFGFTPQDVYEGFPGLWWESIHPDARERVSHAFSAYFEGGVDFDLEYRFRRADGEWIWVHDRAVNRFEKDGRILAHGLITDVTETRSLQAQLAQAQKLETLGTLASGIAHDFNNLLVPILGYADLVEGGVPPDDPLRKSLEGHLFDAAERSRDLVRQILTFSREREPERKILGPEAPVRNALQLVAAALPANVRLRKKIVDPVARIDADAGQLQQVVMNLCTNAGHAMLKEGGTLEVTLETVSLDEAFRQRHPGITASEAVCLSVRDEGTGMDERTLARIFDPFFTTKEPGEGTGLGLSVVYGIVGSHGGAIEVQSIPGKGTVFQVFFPARPEEGWEAESEAGDAPRGSEHILLVDDQEMVRDMGRRLLSRLGYRVTASSSGPEAREMVRAAPDAFDLVLADYDMPRMTGTRLARELLEIRPGLPIILMSGSHMGEIRAAEAFGTRGSLSKPFRSVDLGRMVRGALDQNSPDQNST